MVRYGPNTLTSEEEIRYKVSVFLAVYIAIIFVLRAIQNREKSLLFLILKVALTLYEFQWMCNQGMILSVYALWYDRPALINIAICGLAMD